MLMHRIWPVRKAVHQTDASGQVIGLGEVRLKRRLSLYLCYLNFCTKEYIWDKLAETDQSETLQREGRILRAFG